MAVPKKKTSVSRKGKRRAGQTHKRYRTHPMSCPNCSALTMPNCVCSSCGTYKGKEVFTIKERNTEEEATAE